MTIEDLRIEPEFRDLIPKLTDAEFAQLEKNILEDGRVKEPIVVWNGIIIDGHHRYYILQKHPEIPYEIEEREFANKYAAMAWACANQLGRRNLNEWQSGYLVGKRMENEQMVRGRTDSDSKDESGRFTNKSPADTFRSGNDTASRIANEENVGRMQVFRSQDLAKGIDIAESVSPGLKDKILQGDTKITKKIIRKIPKVTPDKQRKAAIAISEGNIDEAKIALGMKEPEPEPEPYNIDDLLEEMKAAASDLHFALNQTLIVMHKETLSDKQSREKAIDGLRNIMDDIQEFIETLYEMED